MGRKLMGRNLMGRHLSFQAHEMHEVTVVFKTPPALFLECPFTIPHTTAVGTLTLPMVPTAGRPSQLLPPRVWDLISSCSLACGR